MDINGRITVKELIFIVGLIIVMILVIGIFAVVQNRKEKEIRKKHPGYPKGYWMNQGIGIGVALGAGIGVALDNIAIGVGIGIAIGAAIGAEREKKHKDEIRPITDEEKKLRKQSIMFITGTLILGLIVFLLAYMIRSGA
jgi:uncharacterized membrane protein YidH (DUF202 family)